jgi:hypothetical protein
MAGFLLDEAYDLPLLEINTTSPAPEDESTLDSLESYDDELSEEDLFERDTGLKIDVVFPKPEKINPFPFKNLVCFSDASGIYIPLEFSEPFIVDGLYVGSSIGLQSELLRLELGLKAALLSVLETHNEPLEAFLLGVRQLWWGLYGPCERSLLLNTSMYFG